MHVIDQMRKGHFLEKLSASCFLLMHYSFPLRTLYLLHSALITKAADMSGQTASYYDPNQALDHQGKSYAYNTNGANGTNGYYSNDLHSIVLSTKLSKLTGPSTMTFLGRSLGTRRDSWRGHAN